MDTVTDLLAKLLAILLSSAFAWALHQIAARARTERQRAALSVLAALIATGVADAARSVRDLKNPDKPGTWGPEAAAAIKATVIADARAAGAAALRVLMEAAARPEDVDALLARQVEAEVERARQSLTLVNVHAAPQPSAEALAGALAGAINDRAAQRGEPAPLPINPAPKVTP